MSDSDKAESFAKYHDEHAGYGGASWEFHARAATFIRDIAASMAEAINRANEAERTLAKIDGWASGHDQVHIAGGYFSDGVRACKRQVKEMLNKEEL